MPRSWADRVGKNYHGVDGGHHGISIPKKKIIVSQLNSTQKNTLIFSSKQAISGG